MRFRDALKWSLKYHSLAMVPTLLGIAVVAGAVYLGGIRPVLPALQGATPSLQSLSTVVGAVKAPLLVAGLVGGVYVRRVGRTALLVRTQSQAVDAKLAAQGLVDVGTDPASERTATDPGSEGTTTDSASEGTTTDSASEGTTTDPASERTATGPMESGVVDDEPAGRSTDDAGPGSAGTYDDSFVGSDDTVAGEDDAVIHRSSASGDATASEEFGFDAGTDERE